MLGVLTRCDQEKLNDMTSGVHDQAESLTTLFSSSRRLAIADHFRVPHDVVCGPARPGVERLHARGGAELLWASNQDDAELAPVERVEIVSGSRIPIFAHVLTDATAERLLAECGGSWSRAVALTGEHGEHRGSIWRAHDGSVFLPFDPDEVCYSYWSERYVEIARSKARRRTRRGAIRGYYQVRGLLPRPVQIWLRRHYARIQLRTPFPRWPVETALHDFFELFTSILADVAGEPVPRIAPWPHEYVWALVLTHDVETSKGLAALDQILDLERGFGLRSAWNFVPRRYEVDDERIRELAAAGFEVGVHGLHHDGRDLESLARVNERLPGIREAATRWEAVGFRSPATRRKWELMPLLGFDYDSSYPDTDPFEPQDSGCCTWLPFFNQEMVELPLTMAQDHTLFVILRHSDEDAWITKAEFLREHRGMAMIDTHPDYLIDDRIMGAYRRLLECYATDQTAWKALPREVSAWWRRRADSRIERAGADWVVTGPAADEARVEFVEGTEWR
jgi:peptidoglycan/xylan/chitin deacetylase (PgdA/CDA1 family)